MVDEGVDLKLCQVVGTVFGVQKRVQETSSLGSHAKLFAMS